MWIHEATPHGLRAKFVVRWCGKGNGYAPGEGPREHQCYCSQFPWPADPDATEADVVAWTLAANGGDYAEARRLLLAAHRKAAVAHDWSTTWIDRPEAIGIGGTPDDVPDLLAPGGQVFQWQR